jgi:glycosyltransferase involved in cell wall biosynthesis
MSASDVLLVTRQFAMRWGGAEHSIAEVLDELVAVRPGLGWTVTDGGFDPPEQLRRLPLMALVRDRRRLRTVAAAAGHHRLVMAQSLVAPTMINALPERTPVAYFLRDVAYWDEWPNNESGARRWAKSAYRLALAPFVGSFRRDTVRALQRADLLVANSSFMAERIREVSGREALVVFPRTPVVPQPLAAGDCVGVAGDSADKGGAIVRLLARWFPDVTFRVHSRKPLADAPPNMVAAPWEKALDRLYGDLRLMLVPSQVAEAYGRVALEAQGHGVPVLASSVGGLPENVPGSLWRVAEYRSPEAWARAFAPALHAAPTARTAVHAFAHQRRGEADRQHRELVRRLVALLEHGRTAPLEIVPDDDEGDSEDA